MAYEQKDGSGALFRNAKGDNPKRPDYRGDITLGGVQYELSAWLREGKKGKFMSLAGKLKGERPRRDDDPPHQDPSDSEIPF
jgi:hypothetical protein